MKRNSIFCSRHGIIAGCLTAGFMMLSLLSVAQLTLSGKVTDRKDGTPLPGAHITLTEPTLRTISDGDGNYSFRKIKPGRYRITASFIGFSSLEFELKISADTVVNLPLTSISLVGEEVTIMATRAQEKYPTAFSSISNQQIRDRNLGRDIPFLIQQSPSVVATSDAGNGIGYSSFNIRGTDLTRINVTINSIPLNDAESQGVWFVDLPDIASSTNNIQIQRGVGTSTNGSGAFGGSVNFLTSDLQQDPYGELGLAGGSYGTFKSTLRFGTGLLPNKISIDGRLSFINSDGYIDRAFSDLKSYYFSGGYFSDKTMIKLITFSGFERTYQAWNGVPKDSLATNRTYNPSGEYTDSQGTIQYYKDQVDNYQQDHYHLHFSQSLTRELNLNAALHYTRGKGYYENYKQNQSFGEYGLADVIIGGDTITETDLVNRKMMDNDFYGITFSANYKPGEKLKLIAGGAWNRYYGEHFGKVIWAQYASDGDNDRNWYYNTGIKKDFNIFTKVNYQVIKPLNLFLDLQYRHVDYTMNGTLDNGRTLDQVHLFNFFNPKGGIFYTIGKHHELFGSFGVANREPSRNNYKDADPGKEPTYETLFDYEFGYTLKINRMTLTTNLYYMDYRNQLVLTGEINNVGEAVMVNVPDSYRTGLELALGADLISEKLHLDLTSTFSRNKIKNFTQYIDSYDADWNYLGQQQNTLGETDLSFSPSIISSGILTWKPFKSLSLSLNSKYVGRSYIDNTSSQERSLDPYFIQGASLQWRVQTRLFREVTLTFTANNLFSIKYESNAWVYPYLVAGQYQEANGYFPQAPVNFMGGVTLGL